jgi:hypothetical protein
MLGRGERTELLQSHHEEEVRLAIKAAAKARKDGEKTEKNAEAKKRSRYIADEAIHGV